MYASEDERFFAEELALHEGKYLAGTKPRQQSGFGAVLGAAGEGPSPILNRRSGSATS